MPYMVGGRVQLLGSFPGREGEGVGLFLEDGNAPRVARIVYLPGVDVPAREGLWREVARAVDALHHPHIQAPLGLDEADGRLSMAVEHADGETLAEILSVGGRLPPEVAARIVRDACIAVHFAHEEGQEQGPILHGWLRPSHLLVCRSGVTLVTGFGVGLARSAADLMPWQSPEQVLGGPRAASRRSDVHGLGLVLHACLAGENPFERDPDPDVAILSRAAPLLEPLGVPPALAGLVRRALSVKPADRFGDALEMARALDAAVPEMASPSGVAAWSESLFPAGMGMRVLRARAIEAAMTAAAHLAARRAESPARPVPLPEPVSEARVEPVPARVDRRPPPRPGFRPAPRPMAVARVEPRPVPRPVPGPAAREDDVIVGEFSLAAPPFPHAVRSGNPVDSIEIDVVLPDPPPPLRLPLQPRVTAPGKQPADRVDLRAGAQGVAALVLGQLRG
jgi:serine/threonine-protein kinase